MAIESTEREGVSPLELFFDLVFVFAVSQLSAHLLERVTWRNAAETAVMLVAVFSVWAYTSFEATLLQVSRSYTSKMLIVVALVGLFMNAAISHAFADGSWAFIVPFLLIQLCRPLVTIATVSTRVLREHFVIQVGWMVRVGTVVIVGAAVQPGARLTWWTAAAVFDLIGTWFAHPVPGRVLHSDRVAFDADHMIERGRLFLIIALGETLLTTGSAIADAPRGAMTIFTGACAFVTAVALWALYFAGSDHFVNRHVETTTDPIHAVRLAMNGGVVVIAGLIAVAVGNELVIAHPHGDTSIDLALLLFGGPLLYVSTQTVSLRAFTRRVSYERVAGLVALVGAGAVSLLVAPFVSIALGAAVLTVLAVAVIRDNSRRPE